MDPIHIRKLGDDEIFITMKVSYSQFWPIYKALQIEEKSPWWRTILSPKFLDRLLPDCSIV